MCTIMLVNFLFRVPAAKQKSMVDVAYNIFCQEKLYPGEVRRTTIEKVALPILRLVHKSALLEFFNDHMGDLRTTVEAKLVKVCSHFYHMFSK